MGGASSSRCPDLVREPFARSVDGARAALGGATHGLTLEDVEREDPSAVKPRSGPPMSVPRGYAAAAGVEHAYDIAAGPSW